MQCPMGVGILISSYPQRTCQGDLAHDLLQRSRHVLCNTVWGLFPGFLKEPDTAAYPDLWKAETIRDFSLQMVGKWGERNALTNHLMASLNWNCLNCARCCPFPTAFLQQIRSGNLVNSHGTRTTWSTLKWTQDCVQKLLILGVKTNAT